MCSIAARCLEARLLSAQLLDAGISTGSVGLAVLHLPSKHIT
jgi:hypothetical protein